MKDWINTKATIVLIRKKVFLYTKKVESLPGQEKDSG